MALHRPRQEPPIGVISRVELKRKLILGNGLGETVLVLKDLTEKRMGRGMIWEAGEHRLALPLRILEIASNPAEIGGGQAGERVPLGRIKLLRGAAGRVPPERPVPGV